jgi:predicted aspartyl protease
MKNRIATTLLGLSALATVSIGASAAFAAPPSVACKTLRAAQTGYVVKVPFTVVSGRIYVAAKVNGKGPYRFAVDTGASGMGRADTSLVAALGLSVSGAGETSDGVVSAAVDTTRLASLELGGLVRTNLDVITRDYKSKNTPEAAFWGIIGREFFADGLLVIDYPSRTLIFTRKRALARGGEGVLGYDRAFRVPVRIGDVQAEGNLDTGANVTFVLPKSLFDRVSDATLEKAGNGTLTNSKIEVSRAVVRGPFRIGDATLTDVEVRVSDKYPELLVGAFAMQNLAILIDQRSKSVALCDGAKKAVRD